MSNVVILKDVRLSFNDLFTAVQYEGQGPFSYKARFLVVPNGLADTIINKTIEAVARDTFKDKAAGVLKIARGKGLQGFCYSPSEGDEGETNTLSTSRAQTKGTPGVFDSDVSRLGEGAGRPYAGCYVNAKVEFWAQDNKFGKTVRCTLVSVQFSRDGDAFQPGVNPSDNDFEPLEAVEDDLI